MRGSLGGFVLRRAGTSLWRGRRRHLLSAAVMAGSLFFFHLFILVQINLQALLESARERLQITAYFNRQTSSDDISAVLARLESWPEVARLRLISQEQAWRDFQAAVGAQSELLAGLSRDVLPASVEITIGPAYRDSLTVDQLAMRLRAEKEFAEIEYPQPSIERLELIALGAEWAQWSFGGVLVLAIFFIVGSAMKLGVAAHREEIEVMQILGASPELLQAPFVLEGALQGLAGGALSIAFVWGLFIPLQNEFAAVMDWMAPLARPQFLDAKSIALVLSTGCVLGAAGNLFSLRRCVRVWKASARPV